MLLTSLSDDYQHTWINWYFQGLNLNVIWSLLDNSRPSNEAK